MPSTTRPDDTRTSVSDPVGDVTVVGRMGDYPDYDPRADIVSYTLSWSDVVRFTLRPVEVDPQRLGWVWPGFETHTSSVGPADFQVFNDASGDHLEAYQGHYVVVCPVERWIDDGAYVVQFDSGCLGDTAGIKLRGFEWTYRVGDPPGLFMDPCATPSPPSTCPPYADYRDAVAEGPPIFPPR